MFRKALSLLFVLLIVSCFAVAQSKRTLGATPTVLDFGSVVVGNPASRSVALSNTGSMPVKLSAITSSSSEFATAGVLVPQTLAAGESVSLTITFVPQTTGAKSGSITVVSNAQNSPTVITVSASATAPLAPLSITTSSLPATTVGVAYSATLSGAGGRTPYAWAVTSGVLPNGLTLAPASGVISGTSVAVGSSSFTVTLSEGAGSTIAKPLSITVNPIATAGAGGKMWSAIQGQPYAYALATPNGTAPFTWSVVNGALPPGLALDTSRGTIQGTPATDGTYAFAIQVRDISTLAITENFNLIVSSSSDVYGNTGNAYATEGGGPDAAATLLNACAGTTALLANKSYRLSQNVSAATPADKCFTLSAGIKLDLAGFTVTGSVKLNGNPSGISVFNGTINCSIVDGVTVPGCVSILSGSTPTVAARLHHLTITNTGNGTRGIHIDWPLTAKQSFTTMRLYNLTVVVPSQPTVSRSYAISLQGGNLTPEFFSNDLTCTANAAACQGIMCYGTADCKVHHNRLHLEFNTSGADTDRGILFDGLGLDGEAWNNVIDAHNNRGVRIRGTTNVRVHDNRFLNVEDNGAGVIWLADPASTDFNDLNALIDNNDFAMAGGTVIFIRNGINATVRNNRFTCTTACSSSRLAYVRSPLTAGTTFSELTVENNPDVGLLLGAPQNRVDAGGVLNLCNSGQVEGLGVSNNIACTP